jgi:phage gp46-like protein
MSAITLLAATVDGRSIVVFDEVNQPLVRSVVISLFTWRRANKDDVLPSDQRMGWWGDSLPIVPNDRIGSRLWLLSRGTLRDDTPGQAVEYAEEALEWMLPAPVGDGVATAVDVTAQRNGLTELDLSVVITRAVDDARLDIRFANVWSTLNAV